MTAAKTCQKLAILRRKVPEPSKPTAQGMSGITARAPFAPPSRRGPSARSRAARSEPRASLGDNAPVDDDVEVVRYGLGGGSVAMYPRSAAGGDASAASTSMSDRCEPSRARSSTEPTTRYEDGPLDALAIALFNRKLLAAVENGAPLAAEDKNALPRSGFDRLVALADRIGGSGRSTTEQRAVVLKTLLGLIPAPVRFLFKILIKPSNWVDAMNARITVSAFAWLVGPCEIVPRETDGELAAVRLRKCRYLEQCGCVGSCVNFCKRPTEAFFKEAFGVDAHLAPDHQNGSCVMTFGVSPPKEDPALVEPCYKSCGGGGGTCGPCPKIGEAKE